MKKKKISKNRRKNMIMSSLFLFLIGMMVFYVWIFNYTNQLYKEIDVLKREEANLVTQNRITSVELDRLARADRIKQIATDEMNMYTPTPETLAVVIAELRIQ
ncbi:cell division protein FtsL [bacterium]|nr:cell division protein FtsL [bacterium]MBU1064497.1 cell division protein FtsL [bacterium]MBU1635444.1 cell division protein FtsL [bacterium]MBU1873123.1 cell division protein FtsL [bacterium]